VKQPTKKELLTELAALRQERDDLKILLETTTDHSDSLEEELHHKAEDALRKSEQQLRLIVEATPVPVMISRPVDGQIVYANAMAGPLLGLPTAALLEHQTIDFYHDPADRQLLLEQLERQGQVERHELRLKKIDGTPFWVELSLRRILFDDAPCLLSAIHDITERKQAAEALQAAVEELSRINQASSRFVPSAFLDFLQKKSIVDIRLGDHVSKEMTVMFSDLRFFTTLSEHMTPQENFDFVNAYLKRVSPAIRANAGFIVKYLGDGLMAIFPHRADDALRAGIAKLKRVSQYNVYRQKRGQPPIRVGIGVNTGYMMVGMVGETTRLQGDAFSDSVNLAARVEGLTGLSPN
jgi:PAS domain S-box-containing protein